jgi:hypothetical protein
VNSQLVLSVGKVGHFLHNMLMVSLILLSMTSVQVFPAQPKAMTTLEVWSGA